MSLGHVPNFVRNSYVYSLLNLVKHGGSNHVPIEDEDYQQKRLIVIELLDFLPQLRDIFQGKDMDVFGCKLGNPSNFSQKLFSFWNSTFDGRDPVNSPVEVGSLSHHSQGFSTIPGGCLGFLPSTVGN